MTILIVTSIFFFLSASIIAQEDTTKFEECGKAYNCGQMSIYYPFWGEERPSFCASNHQFKLKCEANQNTTIQLGSQTFQVLQYDQVRYTLTMVRTGLVYDNCSSAALTNTSLDSSLFTYTPNARNITIFYGCPSSVTSNSTHSFMCREGGDKGAFYGDPKTKKIQDCEGDSIEVQVTGEEHEPDGGIQGLNKALSKGFQVHYSSEAQVQLCVKCILSNGTCGANDESQFSCFCQDGSEALNCSHHRSDKWNWKRKLGIGLGAAVVSAIAVGIAFYIYYSRQKKKNHLREVSSSVLSHGISCGSSSEDPEMGCKYFGLHFFSYSELEEATNFFDPARQLGDGGFGTVYFGKLHDGRLVAVKRMYENSDKGVEQFANEVEILTGLHHQNLVSLYGCTSRHSRELLLVYEYIPNGTVADHLHGQRAKPGTLPWHIRMNIAIETASALVYLHASDIIHRDVKTNNILLDNHFSVKVADFGLSRLLPMHVTHVSTAPQGTPGYVDPEYHEYYHLTDKSDVYSFGVVLIELISSMPAVDITRSRNEINLSNMAIKRIQSGALHELVDPTLGFERDFKVRKMINGVAELAFQCLQSSKDVRPSMAEVLDRLEDIRSDGKCNGGPEVMDLSEDNAALLKNNEPPPSSPDSNLVTLSTPPHGTCT
ncbi:LEAF RUST 10 DISEASE-RESISTANCE LOCUS RECEPTOR-LIKE PROTEIN KINASE-like 1.2 [Cajanus cajan]|uniref:non-specific serine/threonine protein kinase n=1 Tax=Cajanus cajan TaxID=3821 RepID=A0A151T2G4_CAJCA|nr:LEAF RUST 10 DISEASE-RESISTANCE LOCUS RECEPTOR-LIKE PROTEIN KINASE-like 1.2 [Cajanus cajan]KYP61234.1 putative serine/threonine-protein kinase At1g18390 family [Cajanus cajan]